MFFQPRIFISSLLKGKLETREEIKKILEDCGATVLMYEKNLTPSINNYTYRKDVLEADFIIVILDEKYGAITPSGYSGTEEEYRLATDNKRNVHVYIKNVDDKELDDRQREFLDKIKSSGVSYYLYKDESDLVVRIKGSMMSISKEIAVSKLSKNDIDSKLLTKIAFEHDYEIAIGISAIYETFFRIISEGYEDYLYSDIALSFFESLYYWIESNKFLFNDFEFYNRCFESLQTIKECIHQHAIDFVTVGTSREYTVPKKGIIEVSRCQINNPKAGIDTVWYEQKIKDFYSKFKLFIDYIKEKRYLVDTYVVD